MLTFFDGVVRQAGHEESCALTDAHFDHDRSGVNTVDGTSIGFCKHTAKVERETFGKVASAKLSAKERTQFIDALRLGLTRSSYLTP